MPDGTEPCSGSLRFCRLSCGPCRTSCGGYDGYSDFEAAGKAKRRSLFQSTAAPSQPYDAAGRIAQDSHHQEADRLAVLLTWQAGSVVAEISAGEGQMTLAAAKNVWARQDGSTPQKSTRRSWLTLKRLRESRRTSLRSRPSRLRRVFRPSVATPSSWARVSSPHQTGRNRREPLSVAQTGRTVGRD